VPRGSLVLVTGKVWQNGSVLAVQGTTNLHEIASPDGQEKIRNQERKSRKGKIKINHPKIH